MLVGPNAHLHPSCKEGGQVCSDCGHSLTYLYTGDHPTSTSTGQYSCPKSTVRGGWHNPATAPAKARPARVQDLPSMPSGPPASTVKTFYIVKKAKATTAPDIAEYVGIKMSAYMAAVLKDKPAVTAEPDYKTVKVDGVYEAVSLLKAPATAKEMWRDAFTAVCCLKIKDLEPDQWDVSVFQHYLSDTYRFRAYVADTGVLIKEVLIPGQAMHQVTDPAAAFAQLVQAWG